MCLASWEARKVRGRTGRSSLGGFAHLCFAGVCSWRSLGGAYRQAVKARQAESSESNERWWVAGI
jgi:hypothetical protein